MKRICDHCDHTTRGFVASIYRDDDGERAYLCQPHEGMNCYLLVTKESHPMPCRDCRDALRGSPSGSPSL